MATDLRRRDLLAIVATITGLLPLAARAQQKAMPVIGYIYSGSPLPKRTAAFRQALSDAGYVEGRNVAIEYRWAEGRYDRLPALVGELVRLPVAVIIAVSLPVALAAKATTATIPIVFLSGGDPVEDGLVASFSHPGGNLTGVSSFVNALGPKRLEMLRELVPKAAVIGLLANPGHPDAERQSRDAQEAARATAQQIRILGASTDSEIEAAFATFGAQRVDALIVGADPFFVGRRERLVALAARYAVPAIYPVREFADAGGLISYGNSSSSTDGYRQVGIYIGRILNGAKPADLPVARATKFELVINLKTAKALGLTVPLSLLQRADEVIE